MRTGAPSRLLPRHSFCPSRLLPHCTRKRLGIGTRDASFVGHDHLTKTHFARGDARACCGDGNRLHRRDRDRRSGAAVHHGPGAPTQNSSRTYSCPPLSRRRLDGRILGLLSQEWVHVDIRSLGASTARDDLRAASLAAQTERQLGAGQGLLASLARAERAWCVPASSRAPRLRVAHFRWSRSDCLLSRAPERPAEDPFEPEGSSRGAAARP